MGQICKTNDFSCITSPFYAIQQANTKGTTTYAVSLLFLSFSPLSLLLHFIIIYANSFFFCIKKQGCSVYGGDTSGFEEAITNAKLADYVLLFLGIDTGGTLPLLSLVSLSSTCTPSSLPFTSHTPHSFIYTKKWKERRMIEPTPLSRATNSNSQQRSSH